MVLLCVLCRCNVLVRVLMCECLLFMYGWLVLLCVCRCSVLVPVLMCRCLLLMYGLLLMW